MSVSGSTLMSGSVSQEEPGREDEGLPDPGAGGSAAAGEGEEEVAFLRAVHTLSSRGRQVLRCWPRRPE